MATGEKGRAAVYTGKRKPFELRELAVPDPDPRAAIVKVEQANICGSDLHLWRGDTDLDAMGFTGVVLGHEMVGRVHKLGRDVSADALGQTLREGDRVAYTYYLYCERCRPCLRGDHHMCIRAITSVIRTCELAPHFVGGLADFYYVDGVQRLFKVPESLPGGMVAGANCALSQVIHGFDVAGLRLGDRVVVQGAGGLGLFACAVAKEAGASRVIAIDGVAARLEMARRFGADEVVDMRALADPRARVARVLELTGGGADVIVEMAGVPEAVPEGIRMLERGGRYVEIGNISPKRTFSCDPSLLVTANRSILGVSLYPAAVLGRAIDFLSRTRDRYPYDALISHKYSLEDVTRAFEESDIHDRPDRPVTRAAVLPGGV